MQILSKFFDIVDRTNDWIGRIACFSLLALMSIQMLEVIMRYVFNHPTIWAWDVNSQIFSASAMLAGAYALLHDVHVRLDIFYRNFSRRRKMLIDVITFPLVLVALVFVIYQGWEMVKWSYESNEHAHSYFRPIMWPVKTFLPLSAALLFLQGLSKWGRTLTELLGGVRPDKKEDS